MREIMRRLERGESWPAAQLAVRGGGVLLLAIAGLIARGLYHLSHHAPPHQTTLAEFVLALFVVVCGCLGWIGLIEGSGLFRMLPYPVRRLQM